MTPREVLLTVLSEQDADDVIEHRRQKPTVKPFDVYRATLVKNRLLRAKDRNAAVWEMARRGSILTIEFLRATIGYDPETGKFWRKETGRALGSAHRQGYLTVAVSGANYLAHRLAWFYVHGVWPIDQIDHINRVRTDNRLANLRECSNQENTWNATRSPNKTGVRGVHFNKGAWAATIRVDGKTVYLGRFETKEQAGLAYSDAVKAHRSHFLECLA